MSQVSGVALGKTKGRSAPFRGSIDRICSPNPELVVLACRAQFIATALSPG
jgi:hypothetical protein